MTLICYDGSQDARTAIERASGLFRSQPAVVLSVWEDFSNVLLRTGAALGGAAIDFEEIDQASEASARERAEEGARLAREAGFDAQPRVAVRGVTIWETILEQADDVQASAVVLGSRGLTGVKSLLLGSVSQAVLNHADRAVMVVPSPDAAGRRADHRHAKPDRGPASGARGSRRR